MKPGHTMVSSVARAGGVVDRASLDAIREPVKACKAGDLLAAIPAYDACSAFHQRLQAEGHQAHRRPTEARRRHHDLVVHDLLAGRVPDDVALWSGVIAADHDVERSNARVAAATVAVDRTSRALYEALQTCWRVVVPYLAANRASRLAGLEVLYQSIVWPALRDPPGVETLSTVTAFHWQVWWPPPWEAPERGRSDEAAWYEWVWAELAAGRYDDADGYSIALHNRWEATTASPVSIDGAIARHQPVVFVTAERVAQYEHQIAEQALRRA